MENELKQNKGKKIAFIATIAVGILAIAAGFITYFTIESTTKDYRIVKNNYDYYLNKDKLDPKNAVYYYSLADDDKIFETIDDGYRINIENLRNDNSDFLSNDYYIYLKFSVDLNTTAVEKATETLSFSDSSNEKIFATKVTSGVTYTLEKYAFNDDISYADFKFSYSENEDYLKISSIKFIFYALRK